LLTLSLLLIPRHSSSTLFPYTTLFRSTYQISLNIYPRPGYVIIYSSCSGDNFFSFLRILAMATRKYSTSSLYCGPHTSDNNFSSGTTLSKFNAKLSLIAYSVCVNVNSMSAIQQRILPILTAIFTVYIDEDSSCCSFVPALLLLNPALTRTTNSSNQNGLVK